MRIAIIYEWLVSMRGGEKVIEQLAELYPDADIHVLLWRKGSVSAKIESHRICTSFLQRFPLFKRHYRHFLPLFPIAVESYDVSQYDLIISCSHCVAKGVIPASHARHLCYCYTPMRYIWDMYSDYFGKTRNPLARIVYRYVAHQLRIWDITTNDRVDDFVAISNHVARRVKRYYNREAPVIYPPVDTEFYHPVPERLLAEPYYLMVSALVPYKRVDLAISACRKAGRRLVIIGDGPEKRKLTGMAGGTVTFLGWASNEQIRAWYSHCEALIFPGEEDFGIVPVEVQACGRPVIAYGKGATLETVVDGTTGVFFDDQDDGSIIQAIHRHEQMQYNTNKIVANAQRFSRDNFTMAFISHVERMLSTPLKGAKIK
ncbi:MAG: glycosyltransferase [bacterium]|nr:glycosyltransferase [bacterium]